MTRLVSHLPHLLSRLLPMDLGENEGGVGSGWLWGPGLPAVQGRLFFLSLCPSSTYSSLPPLSGEYPAVSTGLTDLNS